MPWPVSFAAKGNEADFASRYPAQRPIFQKNPRPVASSDRSGLTSQTSHFPQLPIATVTRPIAIDPNAGPPVSLVWPPNPGPAVPPPRAGTQRYNYAFT